MRRRLAVSVDAMRLDMVIARHPDGARRARAGAADLMRMFENHGAQAVQRARQRRGQAASAASQHDEIGLKPGIPADRRIPQFMTASCPRRISNGRRRAIFICHIVKWLTTM